MTFFAKRTLLNILTKYCVFTSEELLLVMRPYQVYAVENIVDILVDMNVASSKRQAREFISGNSIEIKGEKVKELDAIVDESYLTNNTYLIIKRGKKNYYIGKNN